MRSQCIKLTGLALAATALSISLSFAAPYVDGSQVEPFTAKDQHENAFTFKPADTRFLLVSHDMETGKVTVLTLAGGKVSSIAYWAPGAEGLDAYLK